MKEKIRMQAFPLLLAVLLVGVVSVMAAVMVPTVNAGEQATTALLPQNQESEKNIYTMLGIKQPSREEGCQWQTYSEAKDQVDKLISESDSKENIKKIRLCQYHPVK